jgi:mycothiol synthase
MSLPEGWSVRPATADDVPEILAVLIASDIALIGEPDTVTDDVSYVFTEPDAESVVVLDETGAITAWANVVNPNRGPRTHVNVFAHPEIDGRIWHPLLDWGVETAARQAAHWGLPEVVARAAGVPAEKAYLATVRESGFTFVKRYARMRVGLPAPVTAEPPPGVTIRTPDPDDEAELRALHAIQQSAFADTPDFNEVTFERWHHRIQQQTAVPWDEWYLALVDGVPVGMLESANAGEQNEGWVHNLAVLGGYRGRGIARALLSAAFATYTAKGRDAAGLGVDLTNPTGAYRLYESLRMYPVYETDIYERTLLTSAGR